MLHWILVLIWKLERGRGGRVWVRGGEPSRGWGRARCGECCQDWICLWVFPFVSEIWTKSSGRTNIKTWCWSRIKSLNDLFCFNFCTTQVFYCNLVGFCSWSLYFHSLQVLNIHSTFDRTTNTISSTICSGYCIGYNLFTLLL